MTRRVGLKVISTDWSKYFLYHYIFPYDYIITGYKGFIGQAFEKRIDPENLYRIEKDGAFDFLNQYDKWDEVEMILHQEAYPVQQKQM